MLLAALLTALQEAATAPPDARGWDEFPVFVWRERYAGQPLPEELADPFGGVILMREEDSGWARERGLSYLVWNVAGRDALHLDADQAWNERVEKWIESRDERLLVREPCLNAPETRAELFATLDRTIAKHGEHPGLGFVLGDEVGLTPNGDPFDLCRCEHCEAKWKAYAQEYGFPARAPLTDEVRLALLEEDYSSLGAWLGRRRFDARLLPERLLEVLARWPENRGASSPGPYACLFGCKAQTAFGGLALDRELLSRLDAIECYPAGGARELAWTVPGLWRHVPHATFGSDPGPRYAITTLFLDEENYASLPWGVYDAWMRGDSGLVLWSDASLATLAAAPRARLVEAVEVVRSYTSKLPGPWFSPPRPSTVAVVQDADSTAVSFLRDASLAGPTWPRLKASYQLRHGRLERRVETWLRMVEDLGLEPGVLPLASVCKDSFPHFGLLVLPELLVVGDEDLDRLAAYVVNGGMLVVDGTLGWVDRNGLPRRDDALLSRLAGDHPERVRTAPAVLETYLDSRSDLTRCAPARAFVADLTPVQSALRFRREQGMPDFTGDAATVPWRMRLAATGATVEQGMFIVLLPNLTTPAERRARLRDVSLEGIRPPEGFELEWLRPAGGGVLRAGDAALGRIERRPR